MPESEFYNVAEQTPALGSALTMAILAVVISVVFYKHRGTAGGVKASTIAGVFVGLATFCLAYAVRDPVQLGWLYIKAMSPDFGAPTWEQLTNAFDNEWRSGTLLLRVTTLFVCFKAYVDTIYFILVDPYKTPANRLWFHPWGQYPELRGPQLDDTGSPLSKEVFPPPLDDKISYRNIEIIVLSQYGILLVALANLWWLQIVEGVSRAGETAEIPIVLLNWGFFFIVDDVAIIDNYFRATKGRMLVVDAGRLALLNLVLVLALGYTLWMKYDRNEYSLLGLLASFLPLVLFLFWRYIYINYYVKNSPDKELVKWLVSKFISIFGFVFVSPLKFIFSMGLVACRFLKNLLTRSGG